MALPLPPYMIPAKIVPVDRLPIGSSGKLDRRALDVMPIPQDGTINAQEFTAIQQQLKKLWLIALLAVGAANVIGPDTDFFEAGGNSLRIVMLRQLIAKTLGVNISVFDLFQASNFG